MSLLITLLLTPVAYSLFEDLSEAYSLQRLLGLNSLKTRLRRIVSWSSSLFSIFR